MAKTVERLLVTQWRDGHEIGTYVYRIRVSQRLSKHDYEIIRRMGEAIKAYLKTPEGQETLKNETNGEFNWGDALLHIPDTAWNRFGIVSVSEVEPALFVMHDEFFV